MAAGVEIRAGRRRATQGNAEAGELGGWEVTLAPLGDGTIYEMAMGAAMGALVVRVALRVAFLTAVLPTTWATWA